MGQPLVVGPCKSPALEQHQKDAPMQVEVSAGEPRRKGTDSDDLVPG